MLMKLENLALSQLFLSEKKIVKINEWFDIDLNNYSPIVIRFFPWSEKPVVLDGHTRAFVAALNGIFEVPVIVDSEEISEELESLYRNCVEWCQLANLTSILDLSEKIVSQEVYEKDWIGRCQAFLAERAVTSSNDLKKFDF